MVEVWAQSTSRGRDLLPTAVLPAQYRDECDGVTQNVRVLYLHSEETAVKPDRKMERSNEEGGQLNPLPAGASWASEFITGQPELALTVKAGQVLQWNL